jgi:dihydrofolate synthase/folylpolyglutamate synthase
VTYPDAIHFLYSLRWFGAKFGLANTLKLADLAGNPHQHLRFIHVAGTNGKGSTCAMLESIYRAAGLRVGLFTSPHLVAFGERIQVNRQLIPEDQVIRLVEDMRSLLDRGWGSTPSSVDEPPRRVSSSLNRPARIVGSQSAPSDHPTFFEVVTVMALRYFVEQRCDLVIWETGLGGRLDATNIVTPLASVITNIQYDHQKWLGDSLASIAAEKAGIIKPGVPVVTATETAEALEVIASVAREQNAALTVLPGQTTPSSTSGILPLPLLGHHQQINAALAVATVRTLAPSIPVAEQTIRAGLSRVQWLGRLQLVTRPSGQRLLLDGAHNIGGAEVLVVAIKELFPATSLTLVLGILQDKDWAGMCRLLAPLASRILLVPVPSERSATPRELGEICRQANPAAQILEFPSLAAALSNVAPDPFVTIAGSLYLVGEALELLQLTSPTPTPERELNEWSTV